MDGYTGRGGFEVETAIRNSGFKTFSRLLNISPIGGGRARFAVEKRLIAVP